MRQALRRPAVWLRRTISLATLLAFFVANLGLPLLPARAEQAEADQSGKAAARMASGNCCCGSGARSSAGCCCKRAPKGKAASCCAARAVAKTAVAKPANVKSRKADSKSIPVTPVVSCPCEGTPATDFIVVAQPKLAIAAVSVTRPEPTTDVVSVDSLQSIGLRSAPELPPPREFAC